MKEKMKPVIRPVNTKLTKLFTEFFQSEQSSGIVLILCTLTAIVIANSPSGRVSSISGISSLALRQVALL